jgi:hypothetical protein
MNSVMPSFVRIEIDCTGKDYTMLSEALFDKKQQCDGIVIGRLTLHGIIRGLSADLIEKADKDEDWKWRVCLEMLPRFHPAWSPERTFHDLMRRNEPCSASEICSPEFKRACAQSGYSAPLPSTQNTSDEE